MRASTIGTEVKFVAHQAARVALEQGLRNRRFSLELCVMPLVPDASVDGAALVHAVQASLDKLDAGEVKSATPVHYVYETPEIVVRLSARPRSGPNVIRPEDRVTARFKW